MTTTSTQANASARFLYEVIEHAFEVEDMEPFDRLLIVMENVKHLTLNRMITKEMKKENDYE